jgi:hydrogenase-4 component F
MIIWAFGKSIFKLVFTPPIGFREEAIEKINPLESITQFILLGLVIYIGINPPVQMVGMIDDVVKNLLY